ncbi:hypothetical protein ACP4OV_031790 [Aristida adscensionis]
MEFLYRAGDERRSRSQSPPPPPARNAPEPADGRGGDGAADRAGHSAATAPVVAGDDERRRREEEKAKIRERILREGPEKWALEEEVRREIVEQLRKLGTVLGQPADATPPLVTAVNSWSPVALQVAQVQSKANIPAAPLVKRKSPDAATASTVTAATSSKKQKLSLICEVCGVTSTSEKALQDHLNGKGHRRKAAAARALSTPPQPEQEEEAAELDVATMPPPSGDYTPTKLKMLTNAGTAEEVLQMDGFLLCEPCNVRTTDRVTMMCHLEGLKHISKAQKKRQAGGEPAPVSSFAAAAAAGGDPDTVVLEVDGVPHTVRRVEGFLLCELCEARAPAEKGMRCHLSGKKHKNKAKLAEAKVMLTKEAAVATVGSSKIPGKDGRKATSSAALAEAVAVGDSDDSLGMEVDGVRHPLQWLDGFFVCVCCDVKAPSEIIMHSHLKGKKHKNKMAAAVDVAAVDAGAGGGKGVPSVVVAAGGQVQANGSMTADGEEEVAPSITLQGKSDSVVATMDVDEQAKVDLIFPTEPEKDAQIITPKAVEEHSAAQAKGSIAQVKESMEIKNDIVAVTGKPVKYQVEGELYIVLQEENGELSCQTCGVHGCDKDGMIRHLYTKTHLEKARLAKEESRAAAAEVAKENGHDCGGDQVGNCSSDDLTPALEVDMI